MGNVAVGDDLDGLQVCVVRISVGGGEPHQ